MIEETLRRFRRLGRPELVATLCQNLPWTTATGAPRLAACRKLLDAIEAAQWPVPPKRAPWRGRPSADHQGDPIPDIAITISLSAVQPLVVTPVDPLDMPIWNATMATFHPLGYQQAFGARCRARIVNNSRFLILPRMHIPHLASHVLGLAAREAAAEAP